MGLQLRNGMYKPPPHRSHFQDPPQCTPLLNTFRLGLGDQRKNFTKLKGLILSHSSVKNVQSNRKENLDISAFAACWYSKAALENDTFWQKCNTRFKFPLLNYFS